MSERVQLPRVVSVCDNCNRAIEGPAVVYRDPNDDLPFAFCDDKCHDEYFSGEEAGEETD